MEPALPRFAADLEWLRAQGVEVERYNLAQQPGAFAENEVVRSEIMERGVDTLPLLLVNGQVVSRGSYPTRDRLAEWVGLDAVDAGTIYTDAVAELVAIGAAIAANCEPCFKFHFSKARKLGVSQDDMWRAVNTAQAVKDAPARSVLSLAKRLLGRGKDEADAPGAAGCSPGSGCC